MSQETLRVLAGDCTVRFESGSEPPRDERGAVIAVVKPDDTVLVHDREGYRPAAWITRAESVTTRTDGGGAVIEATDGDRRLVVRSHGTRGFTRFPVSGVGSPAGACPECSGQLVRTPRAVECLGCSGRWGIPRDARLHGPTCAACELPMMRVERGESFEVCVDRTCESLDDRVRERFDAVWDCPTCGSPLRVLRRGALIVGCEAYPECETAFRIPVGLRDGTCEACALPAFSTGSGRQCLDADCSGAA